MSGKPAAWTMAFLGVACALLGCRGKRATEQDCQAILDRIVELELHERGFRDPALLERKRASLRQLLAPELRECVDKPIKPAALACIKHVSSAEELSHRCLR